jgi:D-serine deaminase-like pyridoxal phosphate-dependent protein
MLPARLEDLPTPSLVLDLDRVERNCAAMAERAERHGVSLRPHLKTAKSADLARLATRGQPGGLTVSTLAEIEYFAARGFTDLTYAVGIAPHKIDALADLQRRHPGLRVTLLADSAEALGQVALRAQSLGARFAWLLEIDCGGGRGGVSPEDAELVALVRSVEASPALDFAGVLTHAGHSYHVVGRDAHAALAEAERTAAVRASTRLREAGLPVAVVSVGSTPTAVHARQLPGVTEMRPGVYTLFDLDQVALGVCDVADIAASVLATVIGHNPRSRRVLVDAGALALSKDLSAGEFGAGYGYGLVCPIDGGPPMEGLRVADVHQEHGLLAASDDSDEAAAAMFTALPIGARVRLLPNHACMTVAPYDRYHLVRGGGTRVEGQWDKATGWNAGVGGAR